MSAILGAIQYFPAFAPVSLWKIFLFPRKVEQNFISSILFGIEDRDFNHWDDKPIIPLMWILDQNSL